MRVGLLTSYRISFLVAGLLFFAGTAAPRALNNPRLVGSRRRLINELVATQPPRSAASAGDFSISANPSALTIVVQGSGGFGGEVDGTLTLTGLNGFEDNVSLSCSVSGGNGQNQPECFLPALYPTDELFVDAANPPASTDIEITSTVSMCSAPVFCALPNNFGGRPGIFAAVGLTLVVLLLSRRFASSLLKTSSPSKRNRARILRTALICAGLAMAGCSNGPAGDIADGCPPGTGFTPGTPAGTYTVTVVGVSENLSHSITIPVTVPAQ
jgi:hypothetical protein